MKVLEVAGRRVTINIDLLSRGLCDMHNQYEEKKLVLAFGMLDAQLIEIFERNMTKMVKDEFTPEANELFKDRIEAFINDVNNEIAKGVYKYATMVV